MEASHNGKGSRGKSDKTPIVSVVALSIGAYAWFFWFQTLMITQMQ